MFTVFIDLIKPIDTYRKYRVNKYKLNHNYRNSLHSIIAVYISSILTFKKFKLGFKIKTVLTVRCQV